MRSLPAIAIVFAIVFLPVSIAAGLPASCGRVAASLQSNPDPARVAASLGTTRARVHACAKLTRVQQRQRDRRSDLHRERAERGIQ